MGRRSRLISAMCVKPTDEQTHDTHDDGPFIDFMLRDVARRGLLNDQQMLAQFANEPLPFIRRVLGADYAAQAVADQALTREQLSWKMLQVLPVSSTQSNGLRAMQEVVKSFRTSKFLHSKVSMYLLHRHFTEAFDRKELRKQTESTFSRHMRLKDFWPQFHVSSRLSNTGIGARALTAPDSLPDVVSKRDKRGRGSKELKDLSALNALNAEKNSKSKKSVPKTPKTMTTLEWKTRAARSHCSAGSWDWLPRLDAAYAQSSEAGRFDARSSYSQYSQYSREAETAEMSEVSRDACGLGDFVKGKAQHFPKLVTQTKSHGALPSIQNGRDGKNLLQKSKFQRPWEAGQLGGKWFASTKKYLNACNREGLLPSTDPFVTGHSDCIKAKSQGLADRDVFAICEMLSMGSPVRELDLEGNPAISERAFLYLFQFFIRGNVAPPVGNSLSSPFSLEQTPAPSASRDLEKLNLAGCISIVQDEPFAGLLQLLNSPSLDSLQFLNLSALPLGVKWQVPLCKAIHIHPSIRTLSLADTGLGTRSSGDEDDNTMACVVELLSSKNIVHLDLSWNCFGSVGFDFLGQKLIELGILEKLDLAHCSTLSKKSPWTSSMVHLLEHLRDNKSLRKLNISGNYLDFRAALVLEDSLECNSMLRELDVSNNSLGNPGMRSLLRLLSRSTSGLQYFNFENCSKGAVVNSRSEMQVFRASRPHGRYELDLSRPYDRTLVRMLYKTADRLNVPLDQTFRDITGINWSHPQKSSSGYQIPQTGKMFLTFAMDKVLEERTLQRFKDPDFLSLLQCHYELLRIKPDRSKMVALLAQWKRMDGLAEEQAIMIDALSKDFSLDYTQIFVLCQSRATSWNVIASLQSSLPPGNQLETYMCRRLIPSSCDYVRMLQKSASLFSFNANNPTGHYRLDLSNPIDYSVAEKLAILDNWETALRSRDGKPDVSQLGNFSHCRNVQYSNCPLPRSFTEWIPVEFDVLELDYSSSKRPSNETSAPQAVPLADTVFEQLLRAMLQFVVSSSQAKLQALQQLSDKFFLNCSQLRQLVDLFKESGTRQCVFVCFFNRLVDIQNEKLVRARLAREEQASLMARLGYVSAFPYIQPEQMHIHLHLKNYDERLLMSLLLKLSIKENLSNIRDPHLTNSDGSTDAFVLGVPKTWEQMSNVPKQGVFEADYMCKADDRNVKARKDFAEQFGGWNTHAEEISFVGFLRKVPPDVVSLVSWLLVMTGSLSAAFPFVCPGDQMSSREFEDGCKRNGFTKFKGEEEKHRFQSVFRYMDSRTEGKITVKDWTNLKEVEEEICLSVKEVLSFSCRMFGDPSNAWTVLSDGRETLSLAEWEEAWDSVGYYGNVTEVFRFLQDDTASWSADEFAQMQKLQGFRDSMSE